MMLDSTFFFLYSHSIAKLSLGGGRGVYRVLVGRPEWNRPLGRLRCRWENNMKMGLMEIGIDMVNWIQLAQDRVQWWAFVSKMMDLWVPYKSRLLFDKLSDYQLFKEYPAPWSK
jgi:hypothetical protein